MGLDGVELVLEAEESFGITLADDEMPKIVTVGQFYDAIMRELPSPEKKFCLSAVTFHKLRQALLTVTSRRRAEIRPGTCLDTLLPRRRRKAAWRKIQQLSGLRLPRLRLPRWGVHAAVICLVLFAVVAVLAVGWPWHWLLILPGFVVFLLACLTVDALFGTELPDHLQTVGELAKAVLAKNFAKLSGEVTAYDRNEVWESVQILVADQLDVDLEKVTKESRFVADLGMN